MKSVTYSALCLALLFTAVCPRTATAQDVQPAPSSASALKQGAKATVLFFVAHDCPISNAYAPEINRLDNSYSPKGVVFYLVYAEKDLTAAQARARARSYGYKFPALLDTRLSLARQLGATVTPEAVVFDPNGHVLYRGAIDNLYADFGVKRPQATRWPLRDALDAILLGQPVPVSSVKDVGCYITKE